MTVNPILNRGKKEVFGVLVLSRWVGESLNIGDDVRITVLGVNGAQVRIGIAAPKKVAVHREEIYARIQAEKAAKETKDTPVAGPSLFRSNQLNFPYS